MTSLIVSCNAKGLRQRCVNYIHLYVIKFKTFYTGKYEVGLNMGEVFILVFLDFDLSFLLGSAAELYMNFHEIFSVQIPSVTFHSR